MLGKLLKHEIRATARTFLPLYGTVLVLGFVNKIFTVFRVFDRNSAFPVELTAMLAMMLYSFVICAIFVMTLIVTIQRFHKNLLGDEGYLMFTLPVKPWQHITAKMLTAALWFIVSVFVTVISVMIIALNTRMLLDIPQGIWEFIRQVNQELGIHWPMFTLEIIVLCFAFLMSGILMIYASMSLGHLSQRHRVMMSFASFLGLSFAAQMISGIFFRVMEAVTDMESMWYFLSEHTIASVHLGMLVMIVWNLAFCAAYFFLSNYVLSRRLNLE